MHSMEIESYIKPEAVGHELKKLNIPKKYTPYNYNELFRNEYNIFISSREIAKTTYTLIIGLILYKLYKTKTEYLRCDEDQTKRSVIEPLYNTIKAQNYITKIFNGQWNDIEYSQTKKAFTLIKRDDEGAVIQRDLQEFCSVHSNEKYQALKSGYNSPKGDFIIFDEFLDSKRATYFQIEELWNNISTIGRVFEPERKPNVHCIMIGNNSGQAENSFWWDELCITKEISKCDVGDSFHTVSELGSTIYFYSIGAPEERKEQIKQRKIPFFGFNTKKAAQFTGTAMWSSKDYQHIDDKDLLDFKKRIFDKIIIYHRNKYVKLNLYYDSNRQYYVYLHYIHKPKLKDYIILTLEPKEHNEFYGTGEYSEANTVYDAVRKLIRLKIENRWYFENNSIGSLIDDYFKNIK